MVRVSRVLLFKDGGGGGGNSLLKVLSEILVCPLSKQPLRFFSLHQKKIVSALPMQLLHSFLLSFALPFQVLSRFPVPGQRCRRCFVSGESRLSFPSPLITLQFCDVRLRRRKEKKTTDAFWCVSSSVSLPHLPSLSSLQ